MNTKEKEFDKAIKKVCYWISIALNKVGFDEFCMNGGEIVEQLKAERRY